MHKILMNMGIDSWLSKNQALFNYHIIAKNIGGIKQVNSAIYYLYDFLEGKSLEEGLIIIMVNGF